MDSHSSAPFEGLAVAVAAHGEKVVPWRQSRKSGSREDRMLSEITVSLPPKVGDCTPGLPALVAAQGDRALAAITRLDSSHGDHLAALSVLLLRAESVASSKIEHLEASMEDFARASHGVRSNVSAMSMVASADALETLISTVDGQQDISLDNVLAAHKILMREDASEATYAGKLRDVQNWIGGSDYSPRNALYIPPPPETVVGYLEDLLEFANRDDIPVLAQAAIVHAQFESIHPFTDGNGRIGRALINTILRRRGVTTRIVVPLASALVAKKDSYFEVLMAYREGDAGPIIRAFARAAETGAREAQRTAHHLADLPHQWKEIYRNASGKLPREGSAARKILDYLPSLPFFTSEEMEDCIGGATSSVYAAIEKLAEMGILRPLTNRKRKQIWCAAATINELEDLGERVARRTTADTEWREIQSQVIADLVRQDRNRLAHISGLLSEVFDSQVLQEASSAESHIVERWAELVSSVRIPEVVWSNLDRLEISSVLREAIGQARFRQLANVELGKRESLSESLLGLALRLPDLSEHLVRSTRMPESVIEALERTQEISETSEERSSDVDGSTT